MLPQTASRLTRLSSLLPPLRRASCPPIYLRPSPRLPFVRASSSSSSSSSSSPSPAMSQSIVYTDEVTYPLGPYSQAIKTPTAIYLSGQLPADKDGNLVGTTVAEKTAQIAKNITAVLKAAGSSFDKIVKVNIFLADMGDFAAMNEEYAKWFTHKPARSCVAVKTLPKNATIEIECIALP